MLETRPIVSPRAASASRTPIVDSGTVMDSENARWSRTASSWASSGPSVTPIPANASTSISTMSSSWSLPSEYERCTITSMAPVIWWASSSACGRSCSTRLSSRSRISPYAATRAVSTRWKFTSVWP